MSKGTVDIRIDNAETTSAGLRVSPGQEVHGTVTVVPDKDIKVRHVYLRLSWHTEGRGDRDSGQALELDLFQGEMMGGLPAYYEFSLTTPEAPWSYSGYYVNIVWELDVKVDIPFSSDITGKMRFVLSPEGR